MACAKGSIDRQNNKGESGHPCLVPRCKGNEGEIILPVMTDAAGAWYNVLIIEMKCSPKPKNIAELPTYNSTLACQRLFLHQVKRPHKGLGGSPQSQEYEGVDAFVRCIAPLDETGLVLLDQTMNYLLHTRSKNFSIDF